MNKVMRVSKALMRVSIALVVLTCAGLLYGQATNSGDITGTVTDPTGAVLPGVAITVLDVDKDVTRNIVTNDSGLYDTGSIPADHYLLTFVKQGFETLKRGPLTISVGMTGVNVQLSVGQESQQVVVTSEVPLLETASSEVSSTLPSDVITELPQTGGLYPDWTNFIALQPGTSGTAQNGTNAINGGMQTSANGSLPYSTGLFDGQTSNSPMSDNVIMTPIFDAIAEVKVSDSLFSAQYGLGGVLYNQISKGGTDHYHGMAYDYIQNNIFNAASYGFGNGSVGVQRYNDIGGNVGGPIPLPLVHKKLFFFFGNERVINHSSGSQGIITVPDDAMRAGDFTGLATIYDPTTQTLNPDGSVTRKSFASENADGLNKIENTTLLDSVSKNIQSYYPEPNITVSGSGIPVNNYSFFTPGFNFPLVKYFGRFDLDITPSNRIYGSSNWQNGWPGELSPICPINCDGIDVMASNSQLSDVWQISSHVVNEARMGFMEEHDAWNPMSKNLGFPAKLGATWEKVDEFPVINITGEYGMAPSTNGFYVSNVLDPSDVVTWIKGRHEIHIGTEVLIERSDSTLGNQTLFGSFDPGNASFDGRYTASTNGATSSSGEAYADFLLGYSNAWAAGVYPEFGARMKNPQFFVQDDYKVNQNLTLNLGVRWLGTTGWWDKKGNILSFDPTVTNPATNTLGAMWYATTHTNGRTHLEQPKWDEFMPRVGFAYVLNPKTTLRGGFGMYTYAWSMDNYGVGFGNALGAGGNESDNTNGSLPVFLLNQDGSVNDQQKWGTSINAAYLNSPQSPDSYNGQNITYEQYAAPFPQLSQWNLTAQRQLDANTMVQLSYIGSHGGSLLYAEDKNEVPQAKLSANDASSRPYPEFGSIVGYDAVGVSNYHSIQAVVTRRMSSGLEFNANYVWSKFLDDQDTAGWKSQQGYMPFQNSYDPKSNYGPSNFDVRQAVKGQTVYQLPFGKGKKFLNNNAILDEAIGGWQISGTLQLQSGTPFSPVMLVDNTNASLDTGSINGHNQYPNVVGNVKASGASGSIDHWFNVAAFADPGAYMYGNMHRNMVYGPKLSGLNASLHKVFPIYNSVKLDFFANCTNFPNHPSFGVPDYFIGAGHMGAISSVTNGGRSFEMVAKLKF